MWSWEQADMELHQISNSHLIMLAQSPSYPRFDLHQYNLQSDDKHFANGQDIDQISSLKLLNQSSQQAEEDQGRKNSRSQWSKEQQIQFFEYLAEFQIEHPSEFRKWDKPNKKGLFKRMASKIMTKNPIQCRLKFFSFKRKHSDRKNKINYQSCMRNLIISKLKDFSNSQAKFSELISQLQEIRIAQKYQNDSTDFLYRNCKLAGNSKDDGAIRNFKLQRSIHRKKRKNSARRSKSIKKEQVMDRMIEKQAKFNALEPSSSIKHLSNTFNVFDVASF